MRILMCPPKYYDVRYQINPWMTRQHPVDIALAQQQWEQLKQTISDCGAEPVCMPAHPDFPDLVFTANAALVLQQRAYLARFAHAERQGERPLYKTALVHQQIHIIDDHAAMPEDINHAKHQHFEGAGDALNLGKHLFLGYGFRSSQAIHTHIARQFTDYICHSLELVDPHFYHLDTCFCPLNTDSAIYYPPAFSAAAQQSLQQHIPHLMAVPEDEAHRFSCNAVVIGQHIIIPADCPQTSKLLTDKGFRVHSCALSEYIKAGGAAKCLTLNLEQS